MRLMKNIDSTSDLDIQYLDKIKNISFQPVFIMGLQRSGTSILYKMLGATNCFNVIIAYHIIKYDELLQNHINNLEDNAKDNLSEFFRHQSQMTRGIDRLQITPDFPEEYGFLLAEKTKQSRLNQNNLSLFTELCKKIQFISNSKKPLLLKNPFDFSNFTYIRKMFPNAKFIFIHRNPMKTLNSQVKAMRTLLQNKSAYMAMLSPWYDQVFDSNIRLRYYRFLYSSHTPLRVTSAIKRIANETDIFLENIDVLQKDEEYINVRYEDLCGDPQSTIAGIMKFLDLPLQSNLNYRDFIKPRKTVLLEELQRREQFISKRMDKYLTYFKYTTESSSQN